MAMIRFVSHDDDAWLDYQTTRQIAGRYEAKE